MTLLPMPCLRCRAKLNSPAKFKEINPLKRHNKRLLYVCGTYAPGAYAGSEISAHELLCELKNGFDVDVSVVTDKRYTGGTPGQARYQGVPLTGLDHNTRDEGILAVIDEFRPHAILTQLLWADVAVCAGTARGVPTIVRLPSVPTNLNLLPQPR